MASAKKQTSRGRKQDPDRARAAAKITRFATRRRKPANAKPL
jgi:hypothetical protein